MADVFDWLGGRLEEFACSIDAGIGEPSHRRGAGRLTKPPGEGPPRHVGAPSEGVEVMRKRKVFEHPVAKRAEFVAACLGTQLFDELSLASLSPRWSYECTCPGVGGRGAVVAADQIEAQVDPRRDPGRCQDVAVVDEQAVR